MAAKICPLVCALLFCSTLVAQQLPLFAQYRNASGLINPASINAEYFLYEYDLNFNASYRSQWQQQPETPRTMQVTGGVRDRLRWRGGSDRRRLADARPDRTARLGGRLPAPGGGLFPRPLL